MSSFFSFFTLPPVADGSIYYAFIHSDAMGQGIVIVLALMSVATWTLMLEKGIGLNRAYKGSRRFIEEFRQKRNPMSMRNRAENDPSPVARIYESAYARICQLHGDEQHMMSAGRRVLNDVELEVIRATMEENVADQILKLEDKIIVLMTAVSISPFLGLFGTVWGIMNAFTGLANLENVSLAVVAPGIAEALVATAIGLFAAIPAVAAYNFFNNRVGRLSNRIDGFSEEFLNILERQSRS